MWPARAVHQRTDSRRVSRFPRLGCSWSGLRRWRRRHLLLGGGHRGDGMFKNQLLLIVRLEYHRVLVKSFDPSDQFHTADQEYGDRKLFPANSVEIDVLDVLSRCLVFHDRNSLKIYELLH